MLGDVIYVNGKIFKIGVSSVFMTNGKLREKYGSEYVTFRSENEELIKELKDIKEIYFYNGHSVRTIINPKMVKRPKNLVIYFDQMRGNKHSAYKLELPVGVERRFKIFELLNIF